MSDSHQVEEDDDDDNKIEGDSCSSSCCMIITYSLSIKFGEIRWTVKWQKISPNHLCWFSVESMAKVFDGHAHLTSPLLHELIQRFVRLRDMGWECAILYPGNRIRYSFASIQWATLFPLSNAINESVKNISSFDHGRFFSIVYFQLFTTSYSINTP